MCCFKVLNLVQLPINSWIASRSASLLAAQPFLKACMIGDSFQIEKACFEGECCKAPVLNASTSCVARKYTFELPPDIEAKSSLNAALKFDSKCSYRKCIQNISY